jgi:hypothetical protein
LLRLILTASTMGTVGAVVPAAAEHNDNDTMRGRGGMKVHGSRISSDGQSESWHKQKLNVRNLYAGFQLSSAEVQQKFPAKTFADITADQACSRDLYELFAGWLCDDYECPSGKNKGERLTLGTAIVYLNSFIAQLCTLFQFHSLDSKIFFACRDGKTSDEAVWWRGVKTNMWRKILARAIRSLRQYSRVVHVNCSAASIDQWLQNLQCACFVFR